jgi:hypothetical protein
MNKAKMEPEKYREYLTECIRTAGQMIKDMAEDIAGTTDGITDLVITVDFDQECDSIPEISFTRTHIPVYETAEYLLNFKTKKLERR